MILQVNDVRHLHGVYITLGHSDIAGIEDYQSSVVIGLNCVGPVLCAPQTLTVY